MAKHLPSVVWGLRWGRGSAEAPRNGHVRTVGRQDVQVVLYGSEDGYPAVQRPTSHVDPVLGFTLDRRTARLLAKRILACLDETQ